MGQSYTPSRAKKKQDLATQVEIFLLSTAAKTKVKSIDCGIDDREQCVLASAGELRSPERAFSD